MACDTCDRLTAEYEQMERLYAQAVLIFNERRDTAAPEEYMNLRRIADEARLESEVARVALEKHRLFHVKAN